MRLQEGNKRIKGSGSLIRSVVRKQGTRHIDTYKNVFNHFGLLGVWKIKDQLPLAK